MTQSNPPSVFVSALSDHREFVRIQSLRLTTVSQDELAQLSRLESLEHLELTLGRERDPLSTPTTTGAAQKTQNHSWLAA